MIAFTLYWNASSFWVCTVMSRIFYSRDTSNQIFHPHDVVLSCYSLSILKIHQCFGGAKLWKHIDNSDAAEHFWHGFHCVAVHGNHEESKKNWWMAAYVQCTVITDSLFRILLKLKKIHVSYRKWVEVHSTYLSYHEWQKLHLYNIIFNFKILSNLYLPNESKECVPFLSNIQYNTKNLLLEIKRWRRKMKSLSSQINIQKHLACCN